ncbi:glucosidase II beta subunit-like protein-domain-containing protein [Amylocarpus encephaloides]|uniref:Endoplasmic reticulum lectin n=1 Tax=Amylocarpus encephaloides TaxID=45428 RepID=A0A9P8C3L7_9HELO|nr:glucosidase II beta subunit-like protein-domain-containing protein [Amylocarpus encephaloides]
MHPLTSALLAVSPIVFASQTVFSVHDDLLAFPQFEVIFSDALLTDAAARSVVEQASSALHEPPQSSNTAIESPNQARGKPEDGNDHAFDPAHETYELMYLKGQRHLCTIPIVNTPPRNETSEAEARAAEQKELARATDKGWELLQDLEGNCLYFMSGWWSYAFCYNSEVTQFHQLPPQPGKPPLPPVRDTSTKEFILGRAKKGSHTGIRGDKQDEWGNEISTKNPGESESSKTELQVKGDTRYLVQKMEGGTICDLTGKPRRVDVQFHCNPQVTDRIGYIKEVTTCSYLMVIYTPRLCSDVAFLPPKDNKVNSVICRAVVPTEEYETLTAVKSLEAELEANAASSKTKTVGGVVLGGGKWITKDTRIPIPANFNSENFGKQVQVIAHAKSQAEGGQVEMASDAELQKMDLDPTMVEDLRKQVQKMAKEKGWKIEVIDQPGEVREILGIVDSDDDEGDAHLVSGQDPDGDGDGEEDPSDTGDSEEGSEEVFKDEL